VGWPEDGGRGGRGAAASLGSGDGGVGGVTRRRGCHCVAGRRWRQVRGVRAVGVEVAMIGVRRSGAATARLWVAVMEGWTAPKEEEEVRRQSEVTVGP
jgi:hypothetical protein